MTDKSLIAAEKFDEGLNCAQSVLFPFLGELNIDGNALLRMASGFGAGMARNGEVCGAVSGGIMVLGHKYGSDQTSSNPKELSYSKTSELMARFSQKHGSCICQKLLHGTDLKTESGQKTMKDQQYRTTVCKECVKTSVALVEEML